MKSFIQLSLLISLITFGSLLGGTIFLFNEKVALAKNISSEVNEEETRIEGGTYNETVFVVGRTDDREYSICGGAHIGHNTIITAAHCIDKAEKIFVGKEKIDIRSEGLIEAYDSILSDNWGTFSSGWTVDEVINDIAIIFFSENNLVDKRKAQVGTIEAGCNYVVAGFGKSVDEANETIMLNNIREQHSISACIEEYETGVFMITPQTGQGFCQGDSGSPVFRRGTNEVVGVISSTVGKTEEELCAINNKALGVRLDHYEDFIIKNSHDTKFSYTIKSENQNSFTDTIEDTFTRTQNIDPDSISKFEHYIDNLYIGKTLDLFLAVPEQSYKFAILIFGMNTVLSFIGFVCSFFVKKQY